MDRETLTSKNKPLVEALAELEHEQWIAWSKTIVESEKLSTKRISRWKKLWKTPYSNLSEKEKQQDREWALKTIPAVREFLKKYYKIEIQ